ncbi:MAG: DUF2225 domain-containing protein [Chloroflexi bacterium]|nr:DUF2225 domain-containing protein [Chloroflexota bacterium]
MALPKRDIDLIALKALRRRYGVVYPKGQVIFREGEASRQFFIVLQGRIEITRQLPDVDGSGPGRQVLVTLGPGDFFGEMAAFTGEPRSSDAIVVEDASLLYFNERTALELLRTSPQFALGLIQTLCDRIRNNNLQLAEMRVEVERLRRLLPVQDSAPEMPPAATATGQPAVAAGAPDGAAVASDIDRPARPLDEETFALKDLTCPVCRKTFPFPIVRSKHIRVIGRDTDFREVHGGVNPLHYAIGVCPQCLYAAFPEDFAPLEPTVVNMLRDDELRRRAAFGGFDFSGARDASLAAQSYELALRCATLRRAGPDRRARLHHARAWIAREMQDAEAERGYLGQSLADYQYRLEHDHAMNADTEGALTYLLGDLSLRLGKPEEALNWLRAAIDHDSLKRKPALMRVARERLEEARLSARQTQMSEA